MKSDHDVEVLQTQQSMERMEGIADGRRGSSASEFASAAQHVVNVEGAQLTLATDPGSMTKNLGGLTMIALCFNICNSWAGVSASIQIALLQGGPAALLYGLIFSTILYICIAITLAELSSVYPTAGGQYHFASILAPKRINRVVSYSCGVLTVFSWIAIGAAVMMIPSQQILAVAKFWRPELEVHPYQYFLIYEGFGILVLAYNITTLKKTPRFHDVGLAITVTLFLSTMITFLARSSPKASNEFVWRGFYNYTGWPDGVCFMTSLLTTCFCYGGLDAALHLAEEAPNPRVTVPRASVSAVVIGFMTAFPFTVALLYSISDFESVVSLHGYLPFEIARQGMRSDVAATVIQVASIVLTFFILNAIFQTSSRITWAFARDNGLVFSGAFGTISPTFDIPVNATLLNYSILSVAGCVFLGSSIAFNALLASSVTLQQLTFAVPAAMLMLQRRSEKFLPPDRAFKVPNWLGWIANAWVVTMCLVLTVFFCLPPFLPVTGSIMNYNSVVLAVAGLLGVANWFLHGRQHYQGPRIVFQD